MRKLFFALSALAALTLLAPSSGFAQATNQVGLYMSTSDLTTDHTDATPFQVIIIYLVISYPYVYESDYGNVGPGTAISAYEGRIEVPMGETIFSFTPAGDGIDVGTLPETIIGFGTPLTVTDNHCVVGNYVIQTQGAAETMYYLTPIAVGNSIPNELAMAVDAGNGNADLVAIYPTSSSHELPVFVVNGTPVDTESETWGGMKSLYR